MGDQLLGRSRTGVGKSAVALEFAAQHKTIEPLLVGKLSVDDVPLIEELLQRGVLTPAWLRPRWTEMPGSSERLDRVYEGMNVHDLVEEVVAA